jgi:hypothetical protein
MLLITDLSCRFPQITPKGSLLNLGTGVMWAAIARGIFSRQLEVAEAKYNPEEL